MSSSKQLAISPKATHTLWNTRNLSASQANRKKKRNKLQKINTNVVVAAAHNTNEQMTTNISSDFHCHLRPMQTDPEKSGGAPRDGEGGEVR